MEPRTILHVDMDAFYAAVEQRDRPELRGLPVIVGADPKGGRGRGVVATASYEARRFGVRSALPISQAYRLCPQGVYLPPDMDKYARVSHQVMEILRCFTDLVEPLSIDEAFLDVTASRRALGDGLTIARNLKDQVRRETSLTASVGLAASKLVAKVASDMRKPDGLVVVEPGTEAAFLAPLPVRRLWGVGPKTEESLARLGVQTIGDLAALADDRLDRKLGTHGQDLLRLARGLDDRPVVASADEAKSVGNEHTFSVDTSNADVLRRTLLALCDQVARRLRHHQLRARTVTLKYRDETFRTLTRARTMPQSTDAGDALFAVVWELFQGVHGPRRVRLLGVSSSGFGEPGNQAGLFAGASRPADRLRDQVTERFGEGTLVRASVLGSRRHGGPGRPARLAPPAALGGRFAAFVAEEPLHRQADRGRRGVEGQRRQDARPALLTQLHVQQGSAPARFQQDAALEALPRLQGGGLLEDLSLDAQGQRHVPVAQLVHDEEDVGHGGPRWEGVRRQDHLTPWRCGLDHAPVGGLLAHLGQQPAGHVGIVRVLHQELGPGGRGRAALEQRPRLLPVGAVVLEDGLGQEHLVHRVLRAQLESLSQVHDRLVVRDPAGDERDLRALVVQPAQDAIPAALLERGIEVHDRLAEVADAPARALPRRGELPACDAPTRPRPRPSRSASPPRPGCGAALPAGPRPCRVPTRASRRRMPSSATVFASSSSRLRSSGAVPQNDARKKSARASRARGEKGVGVGLHGAPVGGDRLVRGTRQRARAGSHPRPGARSARRLPRERRPASDAARQQHGAPGRDHARGRLARFASSR